MSYLMVGLSHRTAPVETRERFAFTAPGRLENALDQLRRESGLTDFLLLSTCNRTELYLADPLASGDAMVDALRAAHGAGGVPVDRGVFEERRCSAAVEHLFRVTSGLESMVLGEADIVRQVKDAYGAAVAAGTTGPRIDALVHEALRIAKRARTELDLGRGVFSVGGAAADLAASIFGDLAGRTILLLGAGKMGEATARHLASAGAPSVWVANRTHDKAVRLAEALGGRAVPYDELDRTIAQADIVITGTAAPHPILGVERVVEAMRRRRGRDLFLIDIAMPRDVDPAVARIDGVFLYDLDDLQQVVDQESAGRRARARAAMDLIAAEAEAFSARLKVASTAAPMVTGLRDKNRRIFDDELVRLRRRLPHLGDGDWEAIEAYATSVQNRIAHDPTMRIRAWAEADDHHRLAAARELLGLAVERGDEEA